jgi:uncharacterized protein involved in outer membrane biogenesis
MRKIGVVLGVIAVVAIVAIGAIWVLADPNRHRDWIQTQLETQLGRKVTLGTMSLGLLPLRFQVDDPVIADDPAFSSKQPFVKAEKLDIRIGLMPLLHGDVQVEALELRKPSVELVRSKQGVWNFSTLGKTKAAAAPQNAPASEREIALDRIIIDDGQVGITDLQQKGSRMAYDHISGESHIRSASGGVSANGKIKLEKARFNNVDLGYPISLDYDVSSEPGNGVVKIDNANLQLGPTPFSVSGTLNTAANPVTIDLKVKSGDVSIAELARLASAFGVAFAPGATVNGRVRADFEAKGYTDNPALSGTLEGRDLQISGQGIPQPVSIKAVNLALSPSVIQSDEFQATSGKTNLQARFAVKQYTSNAPNVDAALRAPGATLPEIQSIAKAYGVTGLDQLSGEGSLNFDLHAKGPLQSLSSAAATKALNGVINVDFSPLKVLGFDTTHELAKLGGFASGLSEQKATDIIKVVGQILVKDGIAQTDNLKAELGVGKLDAAGTADLTSEALNLRVATIFNKAFSDKVTPSRAANFMNAAFSNSAGEIVLPAIVTGTFKQPRFAPDVKALAQLQKQKFIPTLDNPTGALDNVLGLLKGKNSTQTQEQPAGEKPSGLKGILGVLGGGKAPETSK